MVFASSPVLSDRRLAARPVGAHSAMFTALARRIVRIVLTRVVLPTPGPPVITSTFDASTRRTASRWLGASADAQRTTRQRPKAGAWSRLQEWSPLEPWTSGRRGRRYGGLPTAHRGS